MDYVDETLNGFFPPSFFDHVFGQDGTAWDMNFVLRLLLAPKSIASLRALVESCRLIHFAREKQPLLEANLKEQFTNPVQFQASLYEAYIAERLQRSGLDYKCGVMRHNQPLDGSFSFDSMQCRVECKQPFVPNAQETDVLRRVVDRTILELRRLGVGKGFGIAIRLPRPAKPSVMNEAGGLIQTAIQRLTDERNPLTIPDVLAGKAMLVDLLPLRTLDPGKASNEAELIARIEVNPEELSHVDTPTAPVQIEWGFSYTDKEVVDCLREAVQGARKQHHDRGADKLIICLDSQELDDFRFGLLQANETLARETTQRRIQSALSNTVVLITRRLYAGPNPQHKVYVYNNEEDAVLANHLRQAFTLRTNPVSQAIRG